MIERTWGACTHELAVTCESELSKVEAEELPAVCHTQKKSQDQIEQQRTASGAEGACSPRVCPARSPGTAATPVGRTWKRASTTFPQCAHTQRRRRRSNNCRNEVMVNTASMHESRSWTISLHGRSEASACDRRSKTVRAARMPAKAAGTALMTQENKGMADGEVG